MVGANGFEPSTSWSRTSTRNYQTVESASDNGASPLLIGLLSGIRVGCWTKTLRHAMSPPSLTCYSGR